MKAYHSYHPSPSAAFANIRATQYAYRVLIGINTLVFGSWLYAKYIAKDGRLQRLWHENFLLSLPNVDAGRWWTMLTSTFAHEKVWHFAFNMMAMQAFANSLIMAGGIGIGPFHYLALTLGSGIAGSLAFLYHQKQQPAQGERSWGPFGQRGITYIRSALGASGTVMGMSMAAACLTPFTRIMLIVFPMPMWLASALYVGVDLYMLDSSDSRVGHSAHLGGAAFGAAYYVVFLRRFGGISRMLRGRSGY